MSSLEGVSISNHPLIAHKMTLLRDKNTPSPEFRRLLREITFFLGFEATKDLQLFKHPITTPLGKPFDGVKISHSISIIPILRAGIGMSDGLLDLMPRAVVHHIGMYRNKTSLLPIQYYNKLPKDGASDVAYICDPCIATSNTLSACVNMVKKWVRITSISQNIKIFTNSI
jgi:uracil phosphoribosyltransferase